MNKAVAMNSYVAQVLEETMRKNEGQPEFLQAVDEVFESIAPVVERNRQYQQYAVLERIVEPERVMMFRVPWQDDQGKMRINRGYRVQFNSAIGPLQGRLALPPVGQHLHHQIPRLRADLQELAHHPPHGRRQRWLRLRSEGEERCGSYALLPVLHDRTVAHDRPTDRRTRG